MKKILFLTLAAAISLSACKQAGPEAEETSVDTSASVEQVMEPLELLSLPGLSFDTLTYAFDALEPHVDATTMRIHYSKHHVGYFNKLVKAMQGTEYEGQDLAEVLRNASSLPMAIRNNGGGHYNHTLFWKVMSPNGGGEPQGALAEAIVKDFGSYDAFKEAFSQAAASRFGSGWAWLSVSPEGKLFVSSTANQDNPLMDVVEERGTPILCLDVWEHAYYLNYQNRRPDYISHFWNVVNWEEVSRGYDKVRI